MLAMANYSTVPMDVEFTAAVPPTTSSSTTPNHEPWPSVSRQSSMPLPGEIPASRSPQPPATPQSNIESPYCRLANFEIEKKIGKGQFSVVYRARCRINGQVVALKKVQVSM